MPTCVLLTSDNAFLANAAEEYAGLLFEVRLCSRYNRAATQLAPEVHSVIAAGEIDYLFNFLSPVIIAEDLLSRIRRQAINFHPAPPEWPGIGSASLALYDNDETFGATAHLMTQQVDSGPIVSVIRFPLVAADTCETLFDRALQYSLILFYDVLYRIAHSGPASPTGDMWKRRPVTRAEFEKWMTVSPKDPSEDILRKVRALRHSRLSGPFLNVSGVRFEVPPFKKP